MKKEIKKKYQNPLSKKIPLKEYPNIPPKDIQGQIWGACFDYKDFDKKVLGEPVRDRIYKAWNGMHLVIKTWIEAEGGEKDFLDYIKKNKPDESLWHK